MRVASQEEMDKFMKKIDRGLFEHELDGKIDYQVAFTEMHDLP